MGRLANLSLRNRALIALVTLFVMIFGVITARQLKQELIPSLTIPTAVVLTAYTGASPQVVEERITVPIEQAVLGLSGLESSLHFEHRQLHRHREHAVRHEHVGGPAGSAGLGQPDRRRAAERG